jgi:hypothetical protein
MTACIAALLTDLAACNSDSDGEQVVATAPPEMTTPDGKYLLVANEGEPNDDYSVDPVGSVSIITLDDQGLAQVSTAGFTAFDSQANALRNAGLRIYGPNASVAQNDGGTLLLDPRIREDDVF